MEMIFSNKDCMQQSYQTEQNNLIKKNILDDSLYIEKVHKEMHMTFI